MNRPTNSEVMLIVVNGVTITIAGPWDAMCQIYTMPEKKKKPQKRRKRRKSKIRPKKKVKFWHVPFLFQHLEQIAYWITTLELAIRSKRRPTAINVSWKSDRKKINAVFGASVAATTPSRRQELVSIRKMNDFYYLFPRNQNAEVVQSRENWDFGNCAEVNPWTSL